jgi:hypothetical protein
VLLFVTTKQSAAAAASLPPLPIAAAGGAGGGGGGGGGGGVADAAGAGTLFPASLLAGAGLSLSPMGSFVHAIPDVSVFLILPFPLALSPLSIFAAISLWKTENTASPSSPVSIFFFSVFFLFSVLLIFFIFGKHVHLLSFFLPFLDSTIY